MKTPIVNTSDHNLDFSWPSDNNIDWFVSGLETWFLYHRRDYFWRSKNANLYIKIVSEVLLQRTQASKVSYFLSDFVVKYPSWKSISASDEEEIGQVLMPLGLWRRRAKSLKELADNLCSREEIWPSTREELESMPAVGQYVASAVLLFQHGQRASLMDASMARLLRRYFSIEPVKADIRYDSNLHKVADRVLEAADPILLNWAMLDFAALQEHMAVNLAP